MLRHKRPKEGPRQAARRAEEALQDRTTQLQAISEAMTTYLDSGNWNEASAMLLRSALGQTDSEYGFVGVIVEGPALRILAHEGIVWDAVLNREFYENALRTYQEVGYLEFTNFDNLFGKVITEGKTLLTNEPAADPRSGGLPPGHPPMRHFLGVPIFRGSDVVGIIGVANSPGGYSGEEQGKIEILTQAAGVLYENYRQRQREAALEVERKRAEEQLRETEAKFRTLVEQTPAVIYIDEFDETISHNYKIVYLSPQVEAILGYRPDELQADPELWSKLRHPDDRERALAANDRHNATGQPFNLEYRMLARDGRTVWIHDEAVIVRDEAGRPLFSQGVLYDITERMRAEEELRRLNRKLEKEQRKIEALNRSLEEKVQHRTEELNSTKEQLQHLISSSPAVIYIARPSGDYGATFISENVTAQMGYEPRQFVDDPQFWADRVHPEDAAGVFAELPRLFEQGRHTHEYRFLHKDGSYRWMCDEMKLVRDEDGNPLEIVGYRIDVTERKQAEEALRESEERYRDLYDGAPVAYFAIGKDGRIAKANRRASELLGYSLDDLIGRPVLDLYSDTPAGKDKAKRVIERFRRGRETHDEEMEMRRADGSPVWVSLTVRIVRDAGGQPVESRSMVLDITERKRAEEALRMAQEELESGAELQAQGADAYGFSLRELTVLNLVASGRTDKEIGTTLGISARTAQKHVEKLCKKMEASTRTEASVRALREGLID